MKKTHKQLAALFCIELILFLPVYMVEALQITHEPNPAIDFNETGAAIEWQTDAEAHSQVDYGTTQQLGLQKIIPDMDTYHLVTLTNLTPNTRYYFQLMSIASTGDYKMDDNNGQFYSFITTTEYDVIAPEISNVSIISITATTATIRWATDGPSNSIIYLGEEGQPLNITRAFPEMVTDHIVTAPSEEGKKYNYIVSSCDRFNNCRNSTQYFFVGGADITPPEINVELPEWHLSGRIDIGGTTEPYSKVELYVNGQKVRVLQPQFTGESGAILFQNVALPLSENNVTIVAIDQVGNNASRDYVIKIDGIPPTLIVSGVPYPATNNPSATLTINISEPCTVIFDVSVVDEKAPDKITGLNARSITATIVELEWDENNESDFEEYAVYRLSLNETGAESMRVGVTGANEYRDTKIQPGLTYSYRVSAVDKHCNEGALSDTLTVDVPAGVAVAAGALDIEAVELTCEQKIDKVEHDGGSFSHTINFEDGLNKIEITAIDRGGHAVVYKNETVYDMNPPEITKHNLAELSPTYIPTVTIMGNVSEKASVTVYINDDPVEVEETADDNSFSISVDLSRGSPASEADVLSISAHIPVLSALFGEGGEIGSFGPMWINHVKLVAVDLSGSESAPVEQDIVYTTCGYGSWFRTDIGGQPASIYGAEGLSPAMLTPRLMIDGNEMISFPVNLTYVGGYNASIDGVSVRPYLPHESLRDDYDVDWISSYSIICDPRTKATCLVQLTVKVPEGFFEEQDLTDEDVTMLEKEQAVGTNRMDDCIVPITGCMKVPMMLEIAFREVRPGVGLQQQQLYPGQPRVESKVQKQCWNLEIGIDQRIPPDIIPEELLEFMVDFLNVTIEALDAILEPLNTIKEWVFYGCTGMWVIQFFNQISYNFACKTITPEQSVLEKAVAAGIGYAAGGMFDVKIAKLGVCDLEYDPNSDNDKVKEANRNCKSCESAISRKVKYDRTMRHLCDRLFCPSAPSLQKYIKDKAKTAPEKVIGPKTKKEYLLGSSCACQLTGTGEGCTPIESKRVSTGVETVKKVYEWYKQELKKKYTETDTGKDKCIGAHTAKAKCCGYEYMWEWGSACGIGDEALFSEIKESLCLATQNTNESAKIEDLTLGTEGQAGQDTVTCHRTFNNMAGLCDSDGKANIDPILTRKKLIKPDKLSPAPSEDKDLYVCIIPIAGEEIVGGAMELLGNKISFCYTTTRSTVAQNATHEADFLLLQRDFGFYPPQDWDVTETFAGVGDEAKEAKGRTAFCSKMGTIAVDATNCGDVYDEVKEKIGDPNKEYIVNPTSGFLRTIQCLCLTGLVSYIELWKKALTAIMNCFQTILLTGDGSAGVCQAVLSIYVCDFIFDLIRCYSKKYSSGPSRGGVGGSFGDFFGALTKSGTDIGDSVSGRYGESAMWQSMFVESKLMHAICMWIFTGTWDIDIGDLLESGEVGPAIESIGLVAPCRRRYMTFNPTTTPEGLTTWMYHIGVALIPGAALTYTLKLICSQGFCDETDFEKGRCDCRSGEKELIVTHTDLRGSLTTADSLDAEIFYKVENKGVRYDKAVLEWKFVDNEGQAQTRTEERDCTLEGGTPPAFCSFDVAHGMFRCSFGFDTQNWARFNAITPAYPYGQPAFKLGDTIEFNINLQQAIPVNPDCVDINCEHTKYLTGTVKTPLGGIFWNSSEAKPLNTLGQNIITDFLTRDNKAPIRKITSIGDFNSFIERAPAAVAASPCMSGTHPAVSVNKHQPADFSRSQLCSGFGLGFTYAPARKENYVFAIDPTHYMLFTTEDVAELNAEVDKNNANFANTFYKIKNKIVIKTPIAEHLVIGKDKFGNGELTATIIGKPQRYIEILYSVVPRAEAPTGVDLCSQYDTLEKAKARPWTAEFTLYKARQFGGRYEQGTELEQYSGYSNPKSVPFYFVCSKTITEAGVAVTRACEEDKILTQPCWCSYDSKEAAATDPEKTPYDCGPGNTVKPEGSEAQHCWAGIRCVIGCPENVVLDKPCWCSKDLLDKVREGETPDFDCGPGNKVNLEGRYCNIEGECVTHPPCHAGIEAKNTCTCETANTKSECAAGEVCDYEEAFDEWMFREGTRCAPKCDINKEVTTEWGCICDPILEDAEMCASSYYCCPDLDPKCGDKLCEER